MRIVSKSFPIIIAIMVSGFSIDASFAQSNEDVVVLTTVEEITKIGTELTKQSLEDGNYEDAEEYSKFTSDFFGKHVQDFRLTDPQTADEIHISLLDIHAAILSGESYEKILTDIDKVEGLFSQMNFKVTETEQVIVNLLSFADEHYQTAILNENEISYQISKSLIIKSEELFKTKTNFDERLRLEIESFYKDLKSQVENKEGFVKVGTLISTLQRDFLGTETAVLAKSNLYDAIRDLYDQLLVAIDSGDYLTAEELAIEAYLENFEYLEPDIEKADSDLLYTLEIDMREELRNKIKARESPEEIRSFLQNVILPDLNKAEDLVSEHGSTELSGLGLASASTDGNLKPMGSATEEEKSGVRGEIDFIRDTLEDMLVHYQEGDYQSAYTMARTAYLDSYEFVEIPLRGIAPDFTLEVEFQFAELRSLIKDRADFEKIQETTIAIQRSLDESERLVTGTGTVAPAIAFTSSFAVIFREGLESVLILGAILTYLEASRNTRFLPYVYYGVLAAIGATAITWFAASYIIEISGASRELIEAVAALSATAVLFYVSFWILNKIETKKWLEFIKAKVWQASATGGVLVFVLLSFFTVYREGFETVLFYQAMFGFAKYMEGFVGLGFVAGLASLLLLYYGMRRLGRKLPLRILFGLTMGIGAYLSIAFLGNAIREFQILDVVPYTSMLGTIPRLDINLATMTGIYPTLETTVSQIVLLGVYLVAASYVLILRPKKEKKIAAMRKSRKMTHEQ